MGELLPAYPPRTASKTEADGLLAAFLLAEPPKGHGIDALLGEIELCRE